MGLGGGKFKSRDQSARLLAIGCRTKQSRKRRRERRALLFIGPASAYWTLLSANSAPLWLNTNEQDVFLDDRLSSLSLYLHEMKEQATVIKDEMLHP
jgi:hypothetical protein